MQLLLLLLVYLQSGEIPYKPATEFEVKIDLSFKRKENDFNSTNTVNLNYTETTEQKNRRLSGNQLPYLILKIQLNTLSLEEKKIKIFNNLGKIIYSKGADLKAVIKLDLGFIDDIKDEVTPNSFNLILMNSEKKEVSLIKIMITKEGNFLVNNEKRGKF